LGIRTTTTIIPKNLEVSPIILYGSTLKTCDLTKIEVNKNNNNKIYFIIKILTKIIKKNNLTKIVRLFLKVN